MGIEVQRTKAKKEVETNSTQSGEGKKSRKRISRAKGKKSPAKASAKKIIAKKPEVVRAVEKYVRLSAQKARLVVDMVRGKKALEAVELLKFVPKKGSLLIKKAIDSAIANAVNNFEMDKDKLFIARAVADDAPILKRGQAGSKGRYEKILKRSCHITIELREK